MQVYVKANTQNVASFSEVTDFDIINISAKSFLLPKLIYHASVIKDDSFFLFPSYISHGFKMRLAMDFLGFGYQPSLPKFDVNPVTNLDFHSDYKLYEVIFDRTGYHNINLYYWSYISSKGSSISSVFSNNRMLIAVNKHKKEYLFISGYWKNNPILQYFNVDPSKPESYLSFLKCKMYNHKFSDISYLRQSGDTLFYAMTRTPPGAIFIKEYSLVVNNPEESLKYTGRDIFTEKSDNYIPISVFPPPKEIIPLKQHEKAPYLFNALMKNIYLYRLAHLDSLDAVLGLNTEKGINSTILDSLIPSFDEQIKGMGTIEYTTDLMKIDDDEIDSLYKYPYAFKTYPIQNRMYGKRIFGYTKKDFDNIEFYRIYKPSRETLVRKESKYTRLRIEPWNIYGGEWVRRELFWDNKKCPPLRSKEGVPPPPPPPPPPVKRIQKPGSLSYHLRPEHGVKSRSDFYLLALNTKTREVFFVSGPDVFLTKVLPFYDWSYTDLEKEYKLDFISWETRYQLHYIQDRLYQYLIPALAEEHITYKDDEKMIIEVGGLRLGWPIPIKATIFFDNAENVLIEIPQERKYKCDF